MCVTCNVWWDSGRVCWCVLHVTFGGSVGGFGCYWLCVWITGGFVSVCHM